MPNCSLPHNDEEHVTGSIFYLEASSQDRVTLQKDKV